MIQTTKCRPPHSALLIGDGEGGALPEDFGEHSVAATSDCIMIGTLCWADGETAITLSDEEGLPDARPQDHREVAFNGMLELPSGRLVVTLIDETVLFEIVVPKRRAKVTVWVNQPNEPDDVWIEVSRGV